MTEVLARYDRRIRRSYGVNILIADILKSPRTRERGLLDVLSQWPEFRRPVLAVAYRSARQARTIGDLVSWIHDALTPKYSLAPPRSGTRVARKKAAKKTVARKKVASKPVRKAVARKKAAKKKSAVGDSQGPRTLNRFSIGRGPPTDAHFVVALGAPLPGRGVRRLPTPPQPARSVVPPQRPTRYANAALYPRDGGRRLPQAAPLRPSRIVRLTLDIGELSPDSQVSGAAPFPRMIPENIHIDVMVSSTDFAVAREARMLDEARPSIAHGEFFLPGEDSAAQALNGRDGKYLDFYLRVPEPKAGDPVHARIGYYYRNNLLQSQLLTARFGKAGGFTIETDFTMSDDLTGLREIPERPRVSLLTNANGDGTHQLVLRQPGTDKGVDAATVAIEGDKLGATIGKLRRALDARAPDDSQRRKDDLIEDLRTLAPIGYQLYAQLPGQLDVEFFGAWRNTPDKFVLQVTRPTSSGFVAPWSYVYDIPLLDGDTYELCPMVAGWDGKAPLFTGNLHQCPCGAHERNVLCPFGFWGYRYAIEQLTSAKQPVSTIRAAAGCDVVVAETQYEVDRRALATHVGKLRTLLAAAPLKAALREGLNKAEIEKLLGADLPFVYFYCHGERAAYGDPDTFLGVGDHEAIPAKDFIGWTDIWYARLKRKIWSSVRPLIFINACHSLAIEPTTLVSYLEAFVGRGQAAGVIGTEVKVAQKLAMDVAEAFVAAWAGGKSNVEQALRAIRLDYLRQGNLFGLVYTPYCWSELTLAVQ